MTLVMKNVDTLVIAVLPDATYGPLIQVGTRFSELDYRPVTVTRIEVEIGWYATVFLSDGIRKYFPWHIIYSFEAHPVKEEVKPDERH